MNDATENSARPLDSKAANVYNCFKGNYGSLRSIDQWQFGQRPARRNCCHEPRRSAEGADQTMAFTESFGSPIRVIRAIRGYSVA